MTTTSRSPRRRPTPIQSALALFFVVFGGALSNDAQANDEPKATTKPAEDPKSAGRSTDESKVTGKTEGDAKNAARSKALEGTRLADAGDHERALLLFREAHALYQEPAYLYDIAVECQTLGRDAEALEAYDQFLGAPRDTPPEFVTRATEQREEIKKRLALRVATAPPAPSVAEPPEERFTWSARPLALSFSTGVGIWTSDVRGGAKPSVSAVVGAGYLVTTLPGELDVRLGAKVGVSYFTEPNATPIFLSVLGNASVSKLLTDRLSLFAELGVGALVLSGAPDHSVFFVPSGGRVSGTLSTFELRPGAGVAYALSETLALHLSPSYVWNPKPAERFEHNAIARVEVLIGVSGQL